MEANENASPDKLEKLLMMVMVVVMVNLLMFVCYEYYYIFKKINNFPLEHYEEAVVQFLDAGCLTLPMCFQKCAAPRLERQKT